jgi:hypothetical protein
MKAPIIRQQDGLYRCDQCGLTLKERTRLGLFKKGQFEIASLGRGDYSLVQAELGKIALPAEPLKIVIGNIYTDQELAEIANGSVSLITPVKTIRAQLILEQLGEVCFIHVEGLHRGEGQPLAGASSYQPSQKAPQQGMEWKDEGNLFCTDRRLVLPSNQFTFIRLDRKIATVQAFTDGLAVQRKEENFATYFVGCYAHEAALVVAYMLAKIPALRPAPAPVP